MKKVALWLGIVVLAGLVWYLFIKQDDYQVSFEANTSPGTINQMVKIWNNFEEINGDLEQESLTKFNQTLKFGDSTHYYQWNIIRLNESTSKVKVRASDKDHSLMNKVIIPFKDTDFEKRTRNTVMSFMKDLKTHTDGFKVAVVGEEERPSKYVAYTEHRTSQLDKARGMMRDFNYISSELLKNEVQLDGTPMVDVIKWDIENDSIYFHFCYPILRTDSLPNLVEINYKEIPATKAIKVEYNGNYISSDRAWYAARDYAHQRGMEVTDQPLEVFYNNPNLGGDEINWKAEIYMPLRNESQ